MITEWNSVKKKIVGYKNDVDYLVDRLEILPSFPVGFESARSQLDFWTEGDYPVRVCEEKQKVIKQETLYESLELLTLTCLNSIDMFIELTIGWRREIEKNDKNNPGPNTLEEVD